MGSTLTCLKRDQGAVEELPSGSRKKNDAGSLLSVPKIAAAREDSEYSVDGTVP